MRTFYIASSRDGLDHVLRVERALEQNGLHNTFAWHRHFSHRCSERMCGISNRHELARLEISAASRCDLFIGIARLGRGSHVELGMALAGPTKRIILVGVDPSDSVFYVADGVEHVKSVEELEALLSLPAFDTCDWHPEHDDNGEPKGKRCGAPATHRVLWMDGSRRFSLACAQHLDFESVAPSRRVQPLPR